MSLGFAGITLLCATSAPPAIPGVQRMYDAVCRFGEYSYPAYLWHMVVLTAVVKIGRDGGHGVHRSADAEAARPSRAVPRRPIQSRSGCGAS
ncbi:MAG TPA: hypothetical protein VHZ73_01705 [Vicinamibacterales bacterium]|jgi:peptidoglycan/LPS O-acetylase OafA/YrhL|nr:hypothetical protein [Vicinamibacterales bacterium]